MDREFLVRMSYMEIYNEEINDLLAPEHRKLQIHENLEVLLTKLLPHLIDLFVFHLFFLLIFNHVCEERYICCWIERRNRYLC